MTFDSKLRLAYSRNGSSWLEIPVNWAEKEVEKKGVIDEARLRQRFRSIATVNIFSSGSGPKFFNKS